MSLLVQMLQARYVRDPQVLSDEYHVQVVREKLSGRTLQEILPDVMDEVAVAARRYITTQGDGKTFGRLRVCSCGCWYSNKNAVDTRVDERRGRAGNAEHRRAG